MTEQVVVMLTESPLANIDQMTLAGYQDRQVPLYTASHSQHQPVPSLVGIKTFPLEMFLLPQNLRYNNCHIYQ